MECLAISSLVIAIIMAIDFYFGWSDKWLDNGYYEE